jgi:hypothetical protein
MTMAIEQHNRTRKDSAEYDFQEASYVLAPQGDAAETWMSCDDGDEALGEIREPDVFETQHRAYSAPFRYANVELRGWSEGKSAKGPEFLADIGSITIVEEQPIVEVIVVGSGCSGSNYNIVEWWGDGESLRNCEGQLIKRQRVDNLKGQHPAWIQKALSQELPDFKTLDEAKAYLQRIQRIAHGMTSNYTMPGSLMSGLYENTARFRIGDTSRPELTPRKIVIRGGGEDYEDPFDERIRYPADYVFRLIDVVVKKPQS